MADLTTVPLAGSPITPSPWAANLSAVSGSPTTWPTHQPIMVTGSAGVNPHGTSGPPAATTGIVNRPADHPGSSTNPTAVTLSATAGPTGVNPAGTSGSPTSGPSGAILNSGGSGVNPIGASGPPGVAGAGAAQSVRPG